MRDTLSIFNSDMQTGNSDFPAFYALDLIQFGLKREIPAAIRLGELLLAGAGEAAGVRLMTLLWEDGGVCDHTLSSF